MPGYAAGLLSGRQADVLRVHLATGCAECLRDTFSRSGGLRSVPAEERPSPARSYAPPLVGAAVGLLIGLLGIEAGIFLVSANRREAARGVFLHAVESDRAKLRHRITVLERKLSAARTIAARQAMRLQVAEKAAAALQRDVADLGDRVKQLTPNPLLASPRHR